MTKNRNYRIVVDGSASTVLPTQEPADGYQVFDTFDAARQALLAELRAERDALAQTIKNLTTLRVVDIC